jgi:hypothetical protein
MTSLLSGIAAMPRRGRGAANLNEDTRHPVSPGTVLRASRPSAPVRAEPSWGRVLVTTIKVWVSWRLRSFGFGPQRIDGRADRKRFRHLGRLTGRWRLAALAAALIAITVIALQFAGVFAGTTTTAARAQAAAKPVARNPGRHTAPSPAAVAQTQAAAWVAGQVSADAIVACDPVMCAALQAQGVSAGQLMPLQTGAINPHGATVVVTSAPASTKLASQYAPAVIASFGSGAAQVDVRATEPGGAAGYQSALRADLAARKSAGSQLLRNSRIQFTAQDRTQLLAGEVDSRLLATLAAVSSQYAIRVASFGDTSPGVGALFRDVVIMSDTRAAAAELAAVQALVNQQHPPYLPAHATIIHLPAGQTGLLIRFAAPNPLGLLTAVLTSDSHPATAA